MRRADLSGILIFLLSIATVKAQQQQYIITTVAGGAPLPTPVAAVNAPIGNPYSVAVDGTGNVFFSSLNTIFKVDLGGTLTRVAGTSRTGYSGDGGLAINAQLSLPQGASLGVFGGGVAADTAGNLYIADSGNNRIRKVSSDGIITTVAGNGLQGFSGDGGLAVDASLNFPTSVAVDSADTLYIADRENSRIRQVSAQGFISTVAGSNAQVLGDGGPATNARLARPAGVAVDQGGIIYIADTGNNRVRKISSGIITTFAGNGNGDNSTPVGDGGPAVIATVRSPSAVAASGDGSLYIAETYSGGRLRKVFTNGTIASLAIGGWYAGVATDRSGIFYVADSSLQSIRKQNGVLIAGNGGNCCYSGDGGPATSAQLNRAFDVAADPSGNYYIADTGNRRVRKVTLDGVINTVAGNGSGGFSGDGGTATEATVLPGSLAMDLEGNLYIADGGPTNRIRKVTADGVITTVAGGGSVYPGEGGPATSLRLGNDIEQIAVDSGGNVYFADNSNQRVHKVTPGGIISTVIQISRPSGLAVDSGGNIYVFSGWRIHKFSSGSASGTIVAGTGIFGFSGDGGLATSAQIGNIFRFSIDAAGNLFLIDGFRLRKISADGIIDTIAGNGTCCYSGDGGLAIDAKLGASGVAVGPSGNLYVVDGASVRRLQPTGTSASLNAVTNAANFRNQPQTPGSIVSLFGTGLSSSVEVASALPLPTVLAGVGVRVNGIAAPVLFVSPLQINFQIPWEVSGQSRVSLTVSNETGNGATSISVAGQAPGIFSLNQAGTGQGAILISNSGEVAAPIGSVMGTPSRPVRRGEFISIYCTGLGAVANRPLSGAATSNSVLSTTTIQPTVSIGGVTAPVTPGFFSGLAPGFVGLYQVNVQIPQNVPPGNAVPVFLSIGGVVSNTATIAIE